MFRSFYADRLLLFNLPEDIKILRTGCNGFQAWPHFRLWNESLKLPVTNAYVWAKEWVFAGYVHPHVYSKCRIRVKFRINQPRYNCLVLVNRTRVCPTFLLFAEVGLGREELDGSAWVRRSWWSYPSAVVARFHSSAVRLCSFLTGISGCQNVDDSL